MLSAKTHQKHPKLSVVFILIKYCHLFPHYLIKGTIFGKTQVNIKCEFQFFIQFSSETFFILRRIERDIILNVHSFQLKYPLFFSNFNKICFFSTDFRKYPNVEFHENSSIGSRVVQCGQKNRLTDRHNEANSLCWFYQLSNTTIWW